MENRTVYSEAGSKNLEEALEILGKSIARWSEKRHRKDVAIPGLTVHWLDKTTKPESLIYEPRLCMVVQGAKRVMLGEETFVMDARHYLITSLDLPTVVQVSEASPEKPYLGIVLKLNPKEISQLMVDGKLPSLPPRRSNCAMATSEVTIEILDAFQRLLNLLDEPQDIPILSPIIQREILYRLLTGDLGSRLRQIVSEGSQSFQIARAINWLKNNYAKQLRIDDLADYARMSTSTFHHHFRSLTAMTPLQYQKWLRLHEARRLMLAESLDAATRHSRWDMKAHPNSAVNTTASSEPRH